MNTITMIRTGKAPAVATDLPTGTLREALDKLGIPVEYADSWHVTNTATGDTVGLDTVVGTTTLICGDKVDGATS